MDLTFFKAALPVDYLPQSVDVLIGRGKSVSEHAGNCYLRELVLSHLCEYSSLDNKRGKTAVIQKVLSTINELGGTFIKYNKADGRWYEIETSQAKNTIAQGFRQALSRHDKSSSKNKEQCQPHVETILTAAPTPRILGTQMPVREPEHFTASSYPPNSIPDVLSSPLHEQQHRAVSSASATSSLSCLQEAHQEVFSNEKSLCTSNEVYCFDLFYEYFGSHADLSDNPFIPVQLSRN